jgi:hypothetical protein
MNIEQHISRLLLNYDCVIIPGFGGFVGNYQGASVHPTMHLFMPPTKSIVFNQNLKSNDGLLANELATTEGLNYNEAIKMIEKFVQSAEKTLNEGKKISLEKVGNLFYDIEKNLQFEADNSTNYLMDSFGLATVQSFPIKRDTIYAGRELKSLDHPMEQILIHKNNYSRHLWKAAVLLPLVGLGIWFSISTHVFDRKNISQDSLNPFKTNKIEVLVPKVDNSTSPKESVSISNSSSKTIGAKPEKEINESVTLRNSSESKNTYTSSSNYFIVAGCFKEINNANRFVEELKVKGFNASICGQSQGGLIRVVYNSYSSKDEARAALIEIHKQDSNAWLLASDNVMQ